MTRPRLNNVGLLLAAGLLASSTHAHAAPVLDRPLYDPVRGLTAVPSYDAHSFILELEPGTPRPGFGRPTRSNAAPAPISSTGLPALDALNAAYAPVAYEPLFPAASIAPGPIDNNLTRFYRVELPAGASLAQALADYASVAGVAGAEPVPIVHTSYVPNDPALVNQWQLGQANDHDSDVYEAWDVSKGDSSIIVAIIDSGVLYEHDDLGGSAPPYTAGNIQHNWAEMGGVPGVDDDLNGFVDDFRGWDFVTSAGGVAGEDLSGADNDPRDFAGHGTFCAGMASARTDNGVGIAGTGFKTHILPVRVGWKASANSPPNINLGWAAQGINYAANLGVDVISCSWESIKLTALDAAVANAVARGITVCVAAGNANLSSPPENHLRTRGDCIDVAGVGTNDVKAGFSNYGSWVDVSAAALSVHSTWSTAYTPGYLTSQGTSVSAPFVAGAVALYQGYRKGLGLPPASPSRVMLRVRDTGDNIDAANPGYAGLLGNRLNVYRLLTDPPTSWANTGTGGFFYSSPAIADLDGDGDEEVVVGGTDGQLIALTGADGDTLPGFPLPLDGAVFSSPAIADIDADGAPEILIGTSAGSLYAVERDGTIVSGYPVHLSGVLRAGPAVADLDRTSAGLEVAIGSLQGDLWVLDRNGAIRPGWPQHARGPFEATPALHDFDGDGAAELVVGSLDSTLYGFHGDSTPMAGWPIALPDRVSSSAAIGDVDRDGAADVVVGCSNGRVYGLKANGAAMTGWPVSVLGAVRSSPALADLAGNDGFVEVAIASDSALYVLNHLGASVAGWPEALGCTVTGSVVVADVDGDNGVDVVVAGTEYPQPGQLQSRGMLDVFSAGGTRKNGWPRVFDGGAISGSPSIADPDDDNRAEIVFGSESRTLRAVDMGPGSWTNHAPWPTLHRDNLRRGSLSPAPIVGVPADLDGFGATRLALRALPNPSTSSITLVLRRPAARSSVRGGSIRIYSVTGQLVRELPLPAGDASVMSVAWDASDARGRRVPTGIYFARARWGGEETTQRLVRLAP